MAIGTFSKFYYVQPVTEDNFVLSFTEDDSTEINAEVQIGRYTVTELGQAIQDALNSNGDNSYEVVFSRATRRYTIISDDNFKLLGATSTILGVDIFQEIGFQGLDTTFDIQHTSFNEVGTSFEPQFHIQDYVRPEQFQEAVSGVKSVTASGLVEVVKFGNQQFVEMNIKFQNNGVIGKGYGLKESLTGYDDLLSFMEFITNIYPVEFMPDENNVDSFFKLILDKTEASNDGLGFKLKERFDLSLPNVYDSGKITFRFIS
jgi:hypothetical protein